MKKLRSFALYALVTPAIALGAGSLLAEQQSTQTDQSEELSDTSEQLSETAEKLSDTAGELSDTAEQSSATSDQDVDQEQQNTQSGQDVTISTESSDQNVGEGYDGENIDETSQSSTKTTQSDENTGDQPGMKSQGYMESAPANGMQANDLIGAEVKTSADEEVGSVSDLIIDENGQIVAIVVGVGGFLGMGERNVAIGWDDVAKSGTSDELELRIDATREDLSSAPKFKAQD